MPKSKQISMTSLDEAGLFKQVKEVFGTKPMVTSDYGDQADINVLVAETDSLVPIATIYSRQGMDAKNMSNFIIHAIQFYFRHMPLKP